MSTIRRPERWANRRRRESAAGMAPLCRQGDPQRLRHAGHGRGGPHRVAGAPAPGHAALEVGELVDVHHPGPDIGGVADQIGSRTQLPAPVVAVEHRPARHHDRRQVDGRRAHQLRRRCLVAAAEQHHPVDRIAPDRLLDVHRHQVPQQHGGRPDLGFAERGRREDERHPAGFPDAPLHVFGHVDQVTVARRQVGPGGCDADHRPAVERVIGQAPLHPAPVAEPGQWPAVPILGPHTVIVVGNRALGGPVPGGPVAGRFVCHLGPLFHRAAAARSPPEPSGGPVAGSSQRDAVPTDRRRP